MTVVKKVTKLGGGHMATHFTIGTTCNCNPGLNYDYKLRTTSYGGGGDILEQCHLGICVFVLLTF